MGRQEQNPMEAPYISLIWSPHRHPFYILIETVQIPYVETYRNPLQVHKRSSVLKNIGKSLTWSLHRQLLYTPYGNLQIPPSRNHIEAPSRSLIWSPCRNTYRFIVEILYILYVETLLKPITQKNYRSPTERLSRNPLWILHIEPLE